MPAASAASGQERQGHSQRGTNGAVHRPDCTGAGGRPGPLTLEAMDEVVACPVCGESWGTGLGLAEHFVALAETSDGAHIMWLNRRVTKHRLDAPSLAPLLMTALSGTAPVADRVER